MTKLQQEPLRETRRDKILALAPFCQVQGDLSGGMLNWPRPGVRKRQRDSGDADLGKAFAPAKKGFPWAERPLNVIRKGA